MRAIQTIYTEITRDIVFEWFNLYFYIKMQIPFRDATLCLNVIVQWMYVCMIVSIANGKWI